MTPQEFIAKWQPVDLKERSACQEHFLDLCELLGQPKPAAADPEGAWYCFERGVNKTDGGDDDNRQPRIVEFKDICLGLPKFPLPAIFVVPLLFVFDEHS